MQNTLFFLAALIGGILILAEASGDCPQIITREEWNASLPKLVQYQIIPVQYVIIAHTVTDRCYTQFDCAAIMRSMQNYHMNTRNFSDIGYNFVIGDDGNVFEGVGWHRIGTHSSHYNDKSIGIAFIGNFNNAIPSTNALTAANELIQCGVDSGEISRWYRLLGHRQVIVTQSPGLMLYNEIQMWNNWFANP